MGATFHSNRVTRDFGAIAQPIGVRLSHLPFTEDGVKAALGQRRELVAMTFILDMEAIRTGRQVKELCRLFMDERGELKRLFHNTRLESCL